MVMLLSSKEKVAYLQSSIHIHSMCAHKCKRKVAFVGRIEVALAMGGLGIALELLCVN